MPEFKPVTFCLNQSDTGQMYAEIRGSQNLWLDLFTAMEGIAMLIRAAEAHGKTEHQGQPLIDYVKSGIQKSYENATYLKPKT